MYRTLLPGACSGSPFSRPCDLCQKNKARSAEDGRSLSLGKVEYHKGPKWPEGPLSQPTAYVGFLFIQTAILRGAFLFKGLAGPWEETQWCGAMTCKGSF